MFTSSSEAWTRAPPRKRAVRKKPNFFIVLSIVSALLLLLTAMVDAAKDYYKIMGVDRQADDRTIKRSYRVREYLCRVTAS